MMIRATIFATISICVAFTSTTTQRLSAQQIGTDQLADRLRSAMRREIADKSIPSIALALVRADGTVFDLFEARDSGTVGRATIFRVGSVSKMFTALATVIAAHEGLLDLDAPAKDLVPEIGAIKTITPITLRHLLSHRAGLVREPPVGYYTDPSAPPLAAMVQSMATTELVLPVGTRIKYSNAGYGLAGAALQAAEGRPFDQVVRKRILDPLAMKSSMFVRADVPTDRLANAEMWRADGSRYRPPVFDFGMAPAGFLYTTIPDLSKFMSTLLNGGSPIVETATLHSMWTPQSTGYNADWNQPCAGECTRGAMEVGLAADLFRPFEGYTRVRHGGGVYGFATEFAMLPEAGIGVIVVTTLDGAISVSRALADAALSGWLAIQRGKPLPEILLSPNPIRKVSAEIETARAESAARTDAARGRFGQPIVAIEILAETANRMTVVIEGTELVTLTRSGPDTFMFPRFSSYDSEPLVLERGTDGRVHAIRVGAGRGMRFVRNAASVGGWGGGDFEICAKSPGASAQLATERTATERTATRPRQISTARYTGGAKS